MCPFNIRHRRKLIITLLSVVAALGIGTLIYTQGRQQPQATVTINVIKHGTSLPDGFFLYQHLTAEDIKIKSITSANESLIISFNTLDDRQAAKKVLKKILDNSYYVD